MGDHGKQCPRRTARGALALFPVPDGFDGHAEPAGKFGLGQSRAAAQVAHRRQGCGFGGYESFGGHRRRKRKLLPVAQFDDPSVRFQSQALHVRPRKTNMIGDAR
jgi:hypothetical protein